MAAKRSPSDVRRIACGTPEFLEQTTVVYRRDQNPLPTTVFQMNGNFLLLLTVWCGGNHTNMDVAHRYSSGLAYLRSPSTKEPVRFLRPKN